MCLMLKQVGLHLKCLTPLQQNSSIVKEHSDILTGGAQQLSDTFSTKTTTHRRKHLVCSKPAAPFLRINTQRRNIWMLETRLD